MKKLFTLLLLVSNTASAQTLVLEELCTLPSTVSETSGLEIGPEDCFWTHNDSGNDAAVYCVDTTGTLIRTVIISGQTNMDWEDIAKDDEGNMYIGDFGNNSLNRTDLHVLVVPSIDTNTVTANVTDTIWFSYPDQYNFPPNGGYGNFDMEAMVWVNDSLHLFSKDRSDPYSGHTKHYRLPANGGTYVAELVDSFETGGSSFFNSITGADINDNGNQLALINSERIWIFSDFSGTDFFDGIVSVLELGTFTQKEAIVFKNGFLYLTDEEAFGFGGKLYRVNPSVFVGAEVLENEIALQAIYGSDRKLKRIELNTVEKVNWQLLTTDGRHVQSGSSVTGMIERAAFPPKRGVYVLRIRFENGSAKSLLIQI